MTKRARRGRGSGTMGRPFRFDPDAVTALSAQLVAFLVAGEAVLESLRGLFEPAEGRLVPRQARGLTHRLDVGRALAALRGARTQAEVAEAADLDPGTVSQYETGRRQPRSRNLARLLAALGYQRRDFDRAVWEQGAERLAMLWRWSRLERPAKAAVSERAEGGARGACPPSKEV